MQRSSRERGMPRRDLLRLGAAGMAAAFSPQSDATASQQPGSPEPPQPPPGFVAPTPPPAERVPNPAAVGHESWLEPWVWRPAQWPGQALELNVVENQNPGLSTSPGNRFPALFSFGGTSPGPTIRLRGDDTLRIKLRNLLGANHGVTALGPAPDPLDVPPKDRRGFECLIAKKLGMPCTDAPLPFQPIIDNLPLVFDYLGVKTGHSACMTESANAAHATRVTNLHTHGLHVNPRKNPNGTYGDNVFLRVIPRGDWEMRQQATDPACRATSQDELVAEVSYEYALGDVLRQRRLRDGGSPQPQPPGTHWYHPHAHGSTHDQVSSGMAGFLIIEGDVDDAINGAMTGLERPDPEMKTGRFDYRERLMLIHRVEVQSVDVEARPRHEQFRVPPLNAVNGAVPPSIILMRPGAVERWRVLNGSVDGRGFKRFMVLEGQFVQDNNSGQVWRVQVTGEGAKAKRELVAVTLQEIEDAKRAIYQLSFDGITLVQVNRGQARYTIKDLSQQNAGSRNPLARPAEAGEQRWRATLRNFEDCFRDGNGIRDCFVRPNEVYLGNANRADVFFKAPLDGAGKVFTVFAQEVLVHTDNFQQRLQRSVYRDRDHGNPGPIDVVVAYIHVRGPKVEGGDFDVRSLRDVLPPVPPFLQPITDEELRVTDDEARRRSVPPGSFRTRVIGYSGYGGADFPSVPVPEEFWRAHPELEKRVWGDHDGTKVLLAPFARTMAINGDFDCAKRPDPRPPRKFSHHDPEGEARVGLDTAEEWVLYNSSMMLWGHIDTKKHPQPGQYAEHFRAYPLERGDGQARFKSEPDLQIIAKGADHPLHIHVNPCWVMRIDVPDERGELHNVLAEPRWMDTVWIPRNGGRVVFRTRFADYTGRWVHHCHILLHEDHGMMQTVESTDRLEDTNYNPRTRVASHAMSARDVDAIYPKPSLALRYTQNMKFVDANPVSGQVFPGFDVVVPNLTDE